MRFVRFDGVRFAFTVWVDEFYGDEVAIRNGMGVCDGEGVFVDCFYGAPDVDDLVATLEQGWGFVGQVVCHSVL